MCNQYQNLLWVVCITALATIGFVSPVATIRADTTADNTGGSLTISVKSGDHLLGEPVVIHVKLENAGDGPLEVSPHLSNLTQSASYFVAHETGGFRRIDLAKVMEPHKSAISLDSGESIYHDELLLFDGAAMKPVFEAPGRYNARVEWQHPLTHQVVTSNIVQFNVVAAPIGIAEHSKTMLSSDVMQALQGLDENPGAVQKLKRVATSQTIFGQFASLWLAERELNQSDIGIKTSEIPKRKAERNKKAAGWLRLADTPGFPLRSRVILLMAKSANELGHYQRAISLLERTRREYPATPSGVEAATILAAGRATQEN